MPFKVAGLEEAAGCMCLRFETAKKVQSVDVEASPKVKKVKVMNVGFKVKFGAGMCQRLTRVFDMWQHAKKSLHRRSKK